MKLKRKIRESGVTLIEMMLVLGIIMTLTISELEQQIRETEQATAKVLGNELFMYSNGLRAYISENYEQLLTVDIPGAGGNFIINGTTILKDGTCLVGVGPVKYLPCNIGETTKFGAFPFSTTLTLAGTQITATSDFGPINIQGDIRQHLASIAALTAAGMSLNGGNPTQASTTASFLTDARVGAGPFVPARLANFGEIKMIVDQNGAQDSWLRTDGTNNMEADLSFDATNGAISRGIVNVARLSNINPLVFGPDSFINFESAIDMVGTTPALRLIQNLDTLRNDGVGNPFRLILDDEVTVNGELEAPVMIDLDDNSFLIDPHQVSRVNEMQADTIRQDPLRATLNMRVSNLSWQGAGYISNFDARNIKYSTWNGDLDLREVNTFVDDGYSTVDILNPLQHLQEVKLGHSLSRYVTKGIYNVVDGDPVPIPRCGPSATPKIVVQATNVTMTSWMDWAFIQVSDAPPGAAASHYSLGVAQCSNAAECSFTNGFYALADVTSPATIPATWTVSIGSHANPVSPTGDSGLATVYCANF